MRGRSISCAGALLLIVGCSPASAPSGSTATPAPSAATTLAPTPAASPDPTPTSAGSPAPQGAAISDAKGWVACQCGAGTAETLFLMRADGSDEHRILETLGGDQRHPDFSHDGTRLAVDHLANEQAADDLWIADSDGTDPKRIETTCPIDDCLGIWEPAWSPDDTQLAAVIFGGPLESDGPASFGVVIVDIATGKTRSVVQQPSAAGQIQFPRWSPDGNWLVFWNESDTPTAWIVGADGKGLRALTDPELAAGDPDWSPDGSRILISTRPLLHFETGPTDLYAIAPDGTGLTKLTDSVSSLARYGQPRWSPDGMAILYTRTDRLPKIWARSLDGSVDGPIGATEVFQTHPVLQPTP
jgi:Tol biopolymer transport system component